jgi:hypothetical protein
MMTSEQGARVDGTTKTLRAAEVQPIRHFRVECGGEARIYE